jgi:glucose/arabinose dehydrogenase
MNVRSASVLAIAALAVVAGCSSGDGSLGTGDAAPVTVAVPTTATAPAVETSVAQVPPSTTAATVASTSTTVVDTATTALPALDTVAVQFTETNRYSEPIALITRDDTELYLAERGGVVRIVSDERDDVVLDISADTNGDGEQGLLGMALSPDGTRMYISFTDTQGDSQLDEYLVGDDGVPDPATRRVVLTQDQPYPNHNGGHILFGPDGLLYFGLGDGGDGGDPDRRSLDPGTLLGKLLRIDPSTPSGDLGYSIPADNPFVGQEGVRPEIWSSGLRNPWRFSFDRATGDLWIGDVGQNAWEEIDMSAAADGAGRGLSFGWSAFEGTHRFNDDQPADGHVPPVFEYPQGDDGCSVTGGVVYRGTSIPGLAGAYVFGDYCSGKVWAMRLAGDGAVERVELGVVDDLVSFGEDAAGEIYAISIAGPVLRLDAA